MGRATSQKRMRRAKRSTQREMAGGAGIYACTEDSCGDKWPDYYYRAARFAAQHQHSARSTVRFACAARTLISIAETTSIFHVDSHLDRRNFKLGSCANHRSIDARNFCVVSRDSSHVLPCDLSALFSCCRAVHIHFHAAWGSRTILRPVAAGARDQ
jgi:hypothetical protein